MKAAQKTVVPFKREPAAVPKDLKLRLGGIAADASVIEWACFGMREVGTDAGLAGLERLAVRIQQDLEAAHRRGGVMKGKPKDNSTSTMLDIVDRIADLRDRISVISVAINGLKDIDGPTRDGMTKLCGEMIDEVQALGEVLQARASASAKV